MSDINKALAIIGWGIVSFILTGVAIVSGGVPEACAVAIFGWIVWFIVLFGTGLVGGHSSREILSPVEAKKREEDTKAKRLDEYIKMRKENCLPTQDDLQAIADKFGFTLKGEFSIDNNYCKMKHSRFQMETHMSIDDLKNIGINTYKDIFGKYFLFFRFEGMTPCIEEYFDEHLNKKYKRNDNNMMFFFTYSPKYDENKNVAWDDDYIIMIVENLNGFDIYRSSRIEHCQSKGAMTDNEKTFVIKGKNNRSHHCCSCVKGVLSSFIDYARFGCNACYMVSPDCPMLLK